MKETESIPEQLTKRRIGRVLLIMAALLVFGAGMLGGVAFEQSRHNLNLAKFWRVYDLISDRYVNTPDESKLVDGAVKGLVEALDDPYSAYLPPQEKTDLTDELKGEFEGIGAELTDKNSLITVVAPLAGSPAEKAGIKPNDVIVKIDDTSTDKMTVGEAVKLIRGPKGSEVRLTVLRGEPAEELELKITRETIVVESVSSKIITSAGQTIGYLEITQFGDDTVDGARAAMEGLLAKNPKAIVVDLRNNPGGYLNAVPPIAGLFLPPSVIVKEKYRDGHSDELKSSNVPIAPNTPLYVLINEGSASAAEILAGALQDYKRATLVGKKSFGKGSVQDLVDLSGESALRITIAEWLTPNGRAINKVGIEPDVKVDGDKTDTSDPVLDKALELAVK